MLQPVEPSTRATHALSSSRILVTGARGFIGSHLTERLVQAGATVRVLFPYNLRHPWGWLEHVDEDVQTALDVVMGDLRDPAMVQRAVSDCQVVFHLGAVITPPAPLQASRIFIDTNIKGTLNVLEACRCERRVEKVIHASSSVIYGSPRYTPIDEDHPLQQLESSYAKSKIAADILGQNFHLAGLPITTLRLFNTYGPRQSTRAVIPTMITQALTGDTIRLGDLTPVRDFIFVEDIVSAFMKAAESPGSIGQVFNVGTGQGVTIGAVAAQVIEICGGQKTIVVDEQRLRPAPSEVTNLVCDYTKARTLLGWEPQFPLRHGLEKTLAYIRDHLHWY